MAKEMKLTEWFGRDQQPAIAGAYEVSPDGDNRWYSYFNGDHWGWITYTPDGAVRDFHKCKFSTMAKWRGLADKPE